MGLVRFGPLVLRWCLNCNIPVVEQRECGICKSQTVEVQVTPPGDVKIAFNKELRLFRKILDKQFGKGCGTALFPRNKLVVLNPVPSIDKMYEVVMDGQVVASVRYDIKKGWQTLLRMEGVFRIEKNISRQFVVADDGAIEPILNGSNLMAVGVLETSNDIAEGDEVIVLDKMKKPFAVGTAKMDAQEMKSAINAGEKKGVAVKVRWREAWRKARILQDRIISWKQVAEGSKTALQNKERMALNFIQNVAKKYNKEIAVSFSGGKDSLVTLLLVLKAGFKPRILFVDTGLELPETLEYVKKIAEKLGVEIITESAGNAFWENLEMFGPPGRDFRWCCKLCKLGPTTRLISKNFPDGAVVFIGQRVYESEQRAQKGNIWENPWVPGQIGASPVQYWNALHIWLYIMKEGMDVNPWYAEGMERIGCFLCPASSIGDFIIIGKKYEGLKKWEKYLKEYAEKNGFGEEFLKYALWRWRRLPRGIKEYIGEFEFERNGADVKLNLADGYSPCTGGYSIEGVYNRKLDIERIGNLLNILGTSKIDRENNLCEIEGIQIFADGAVVVKGNDEQELRAKLTNMHSVVMKALFCVKCGICTGRCAQKAITLKEKGIHINPELCIHCGNCIQPCPALVYRMDAEIW